MNHNPTKTQPSANGSPLPADSYQLTAHHLRFTLKAETAIELDSQQGSAFRGMLFNALRGPKNNPALGFCTQRQLTTCAGCALVAACPVAGLVSTLNPRAERGRDVPRPYAIVPSRFGQTRYEPDELFSFGLTLFGDALNLFPYVVMALRQAGPNGLGKRLRRPEAKNRYLRGRFAVQSAQSINLLTGEVQDILEAGSTLVQQPLLPVTHAQIVETGQQLLSTGGNGSANGRPGGSIDSLPITVQFITPARIVNRGQLVKTPYFSPLFHRLLDRLILLEREYGDQALAEPAEVLDKNALLALGDRVELLNHNTRWLDVWSRSARQGKKTPISGFVGPATYRATREIWETLLPYLLWGSVIHVGKNAVKGDGIIAVSR
jgi:hypothetical protein